MNRQENVLKYARCSVFSFFFCSRRHFPLEFGNVSKHRYLSHSPDHISQNKKQSICNFRKLSKVMIQSVISLCSLMSLHAGFRS